LTFRSRLNIIVDMLLEKLSTTGTYIKGKQGGLLWQH